MSGVARAVGSIAGFIIGGPVGSLIGSAIGSAIDQSFGRRQRINPQPGLDDGITLQSATWGRAIPWIFGAYRCGGNLIWVADEYIYWIRRFRQAATDSEIRANFAVGICRGPIERVLRIWVDGGLVADFTSEDGINELGKLGKEFELRIYLGDETQVQDPTILELETAKGNPVPAYRGLAYAVFINLDINQTGGRIPEIEWEVATSVEEYVPYEEVPIIPTIQVPDPPDNSWAGDVLNVISWETEDLLETFGGTGRGTSITNVGSPAPSGQSRSMQMVSTAGNTMYVSLSKPDPTDGSLSGFTFGTNDVYVTFYFRYVSAPDSGNVPILAWYSSSARLASLAIGSDGYLRFYNSSDTLVATSSQPVTAATWVRIDALHGNGLSSNYVVKIDGTTVIDSNASSVTTAKEFIRIGKSWNSGGDFTCWYGPVIATTGAFLPDGDLYASIRRPVAKLDDYPEAGDADDPLEPEPIQKNVWFRGFYNPPPTGNWDIATPSTIEKMYIALGFFGIGESDVGVSYTGLVPASASTDAFFAVACGPVANGDYTTALVFAVKTHIVCADANPAAGVSGAIDTRMYLGEDLGGGLLGISTGVETSSNSPPGNQTFEGTDIVRTVNPGTSSIFTLGEANLVFPGARSSAIESPVVAQASVIVLHGTLGNDTTDFRIDAEDNLVFFADENRCLIMEQGIWDIYDCRARNVPVHVEYRTTDGLEQILPIAGCDFDIDEFGVVYSAEWTESSDTTEATIVKMDGQTLRITDVVFVVDDAVLHSPTRVRVSRNPDFPWLAIISDSGSTLKLLNRETLMWGSAYHETVAVPTGFLFVAMDIDDETGTIWLLCNEDDSAPTTSRIVRIVPNEPVPPTATVFDISSDMGGLPSAIKWNQATLELMVGRSSATEKVVWYSVDGDTLTLEASTTTVGCMSDYPKSAWRRGSFDGKLFYAYNAGSGSYTIKALSMVTHSIYKTWTVEPNSGGSEIPHWVGGSIFDISGYSIITGCDLIGAAYCRVWLDRAAVAPLTLGEIVAALCEDVGVGSSERQTSTLTQSVYGFAIADRMPARSAIESLMEVFFFDKSEHDGKVYFVNRAGSVVVTIPEADLAAHEFGQDRPQNVILTRQQSSELPLVIEIGYRDREREYRQSVESSFRQVVESKGIPAFDTAVALTSQEARQAVEKRHRYEWLAQSKPTISIPPQYLYLTPTDLIVVQANGYSYTSRIDGISLSPTLLLAAELTIEASSVYDSTAGGNSIPAGNDDQAPGPSELFLMDIGLLAVADDRAGVYLAVLGVTDAWVGADIDLSRDGGGSFQPWASSDELGIIGSALTALADVASPWILDRGNTVRVKLRAGHTISSSTEAGILAGANRALLGDEIIHFATVTAVSGEADTYDLSLLLRGRRGTEGETGSHAAGDRFVMLSPAVTAFGGLEIGDLGQELRFRVTSIGRIVPPAVTYFLTPEFRNLKPLSPQHVQGSRDGSSNLTISWLRRCRFRGTGELGYDFPIGETTEAYEVDVLDAPGGTVLRTLTATSESVAYTAAQQTTDFGSAQSAIDVVVYQISGKVDRGYGTVAVV